MTTRRWCAVVLLAASWISATYAAEKEGVAVVIVYDTSGSMQQRVRDADGRQLPKHVIANRALRSVVERLEAVSRAPEGSRLPLEVGLIVFQRNQAHTALELAPFAPERFRSWLEQQMNFQAGTPLGSAVREAGEALLQSNLPRKHVLVITDGVNTTGPDPASAMPRLQRAAEQSGRPLSFHFIAFDVNAKVFAKVKDLGATVVSAADEKQLNAQLEFVLEKKILLEDEEPPSNHSSN